MTHTQHSRTWPVVAIAMGFLLLTSTEARAWDDCDWHGRSRWHHWHEYDRHGHEWRRGGFTIVLGDGWARPYSPPVRYATVVPDVSNDIVVINVLNANGSYTPVTLRRVGGVYVGPRGEQYLNLPNVEQLRVYGLQ